MNFLFMLSWSNFSNEESSGMITNGRLPMMWAQSLYVIGCLLKEKQVAIGELDPINRRLSSQPRPETIVQVNLDWGF